ncbi:MAG: DUF2164 domain-containing protein [Candidatus Kapabacteria bacterium]|nr:DUF2164 domain-containing protein [Candidatus Kapabacteria bacterium]
MTMIEFSPAHRQALIDRVRTYCNDELSIELGRFDAEFLVDFFNREIGPYYYNQGLFDAQAALLKRMDDVKDAIVSLEKPTP